MRDPNGDRDRMVLHKGASLIELLWPQKWTEIKIILVPKHKFRFSKYYLSNQQVGFSCLTSVGKLYFEILLLSEHDQ